MGGLSFIEYIERDCYRARRFRMPMFNRSHNPFHELISTQQIASRVAELGAKITLDYKDVGSNLVVIGVLKGCILFLSDLIRAIALPLRLDFIRIASYGNATVSSGVVQITSDLGHSVEDQHVLVVEDIIDTGLTASYLLKNLNTRKPASLRLCSLLHKPERTIREVPIDYLGFTIPDKFVVGYGLDSEEQYRNMPFIGYTDAHETTETLTSS